MHLRRSAMAWPVSGLLLLCLVHVRTVAAELQPESTAAYERYIADATKVFLEEHRSLAVPRDGEVIVRPARQDGIVSVPDGLVHHWTGATFIDRVTLADALAISSAYENYHAVYRAITSSRLLRRDGDTYHVQLRIKEGAAGVTAVLQVRASVKFFFPTSTTAYSISTSDEIREVKDAGETTEQLLPAGQRQRLLVARGHSEPAHRARRRRGGRDGDHRTEPRLSADAGLIIEPIARRLGRKSVELSLRNSPALSGRAKQGDDGDYAVDACTGVDIETVCDRGMISHASAYAMTPPITAQPRMETITQTRRTTVGSTAKYFRQAAAHAGDPPLGVGTRQPPANRHACGVGAFGDDEPRSQVGEHATDDGAGNNREHDPRNADDDDIDLEILRHSGADACDVSIYARTGQTANRHTHLTNR